MADDKRTRNLGRPCWGVVVVDDERAEVWAEVLGQPAYKDRRSADAWLKENGEPGLTYEYHRVDDDSRVTVGEPDWADDAREAGWVAADEVEALRAELAELRGEK